MTKQEHVILCCAVVSLSEAISLFAADRFILSAYTSFSFSDTAAINLSTVLSMETVAMMVFKTINLDQLRI